MAVHTVPNSSFSPQLDTQEIAREVERISEECRQYLSTERQRITDLRLALFARSQGRCELKRSTKCLDWISWGTMRAHIVSSSMTTHLREHGLYTLSNLRAACPECHIDSKGKRA